MEFFLASTWLTRDNITLAIAILGAVLGILNFVVGWLRNRARLRVVPKLYVHEGPHRSLRWDRPLADDFLTRHGYTDPPQWCVEVQNNSDKSITVDDIGFGRRGAKTRTVINPIFFDNKNLPRRLEPHSSFVGYSAYTPEALWKKYGRVDFAFAQTQTDKVFRGSSRILKHVGKSLCGA